MTLLRQTSRRTRTTTVAPRIGLFGYLGSGNLGNDGSLEAMHAYLKAEHSDAILDFLCSGPEQLTARYGAPATRLGWYHEEDRKGSGMAAVALESSSLETPSSMRAIRQRMKLVD